MKKRMVVAFILVLIVLLGACADKAVIEITAAPSSASQGPNSMPARPGSGVTGDPSAILKDLTNVSGTVKEIKQDLVLITLKDGGGDFMLRFTDKTIWDEGVSKDIKVGNNMECLVKLEPTFAPPSQGEVYEIISNTAC